MYYFYGRALTLHVANNSQLFGGPAEETGGADDDDDEEDDNVDDDNNNDNHKSSSNTVETPGSKTAAAPAVGTYKSCHVPAWRPGSSQGTHAHAGQHLVDRTP